MPTCKECGAGHTEDSGFCHKCGAKLVAAPQPLMSMPPEAWALVTQANERVTELERALEEAVVRVESLEASRKKTTEWIAYFEYKTELIPNTNLISKNFWTRACAVWGHALCAGMVVSLPLYGLALMIGLGSR